jgi:hypothetical protein
MSRNEKQYLPVIMRLNEEECEEEMYNAWEVRS